MRSFAIIGLGEFGKCMLSTLHERGFDTLVVDRDDAKIQWARDLASKAVKADAMNAELFKELIDDHTECAIVDLGDQMERSILVTNYLAKRGVRHVIVEAMNEAHAEILRIVGATRIIHPEKEAAERLAGLLAGQGRLDYFPIGKSFSLIEIPTPTKWVGKTLLDLAVRKNHGINVVAVRNPPTSGETEAWTFPNPESPLEPTDILLIAGPTSDAEKLAH